MLILLCAHRQLQRWQFLPSANSKPSCSRLLPHLLVATKSRPRRPQSRLELTSPALIKVKTASFTEFQSRTTTFPLAKFLHLPNLFLQSWTIPLFIFVTDWYSKGPSANSLIQTLHVCVLLASDSRHKFRSEYDFRFFIEHWSIWFSTRPVSTSDSTCFCLQLGLQSSMNWTKHVRHKSDLSRLMWWFGAHFKSDSSLSQARFDAF